MKETFRRRWPWLAAAAAAALLLSNQGARSWLRGLLEYRSLQRELARLKAEETSLDRDLKAIQKDDATLERAARKELGLVKPGEVEYRVPSEK